MKHVISIDIGGTKTLGALFNENAEILKSIRIPTQPKLGPDNLIESLFKIIDELSQLEKIDCISIGSAGRVNTDDGTIFYSSDNIPNWTGVKLKEIVENKYNILTVVENDCKVTGLGEEWKGAALGTKSYVCIALGTGIGAAVKYDEVLLHGAHWSAAELGHMLLYPKGRQCNCGLKGCFEQYCSGPSLVKRYNDLTEVKIRNGYEFFDLVKNKDSNALLVLNEFTEDLSMAIISILNIYDPEVVILGGGLIDTKEYWWNQMMEIIKRSSISRLFVPRIEPALLGSSAAIYGAAYLGFNTIK